jgi:hypothetical protein
MGNVLLADLIALIHLAYVSFVVLGQLVILVGLVFRWGWVRNLWFRLVHLLAIVVVAVEAVLKVPCPLTVWEYHLRGSVPADGTEPSFVADLVHFFIVHDWPPQWFFDATNIGFGVLVLGTFVLAPPRWRRHCSPGRGGIG